MPNINRRQLIKLGLVSSATFVLPITGCAEPDSSVGLVSKDGFYANGYLLLTEANELVLLLDRVEMGQGIERAFALIVATELNMSASDITVRNARIGRNQNSLLSPPPWGTVGSASVRWAWTGLRIASAQLKELFLQAAAVSNDTNAKDCYLEGLVVKQKYSDQINSLASLIPIAARLPIPQMDLQQERRPKAELDQGDLNQQYFVSRSTGQLQYGIDVDIPGMLAAVILKPPGPTASLRGYQFKNPATVPASVKLIEVEGSLAVIADTYWQALKATEQVAIQWDILLQHESNATIYQRLQQQLDKAWDHSITAVNEESTDFIERDFQVPYLAHFCMEPMNCTVSYQQDLCEVWAPTQRPSAALEAVQRITGLTADQISINVPPLGGGFGQRIAIDYVREATQLSMQLKSPVKLIYPRQSDLWGDTFRPAAAARCRAYFDSTGNLQSWYQQVISTADASGDEPSDFDRAIHWSKRAAKDLLSSVTNTGQQRLAFNAYPIDKSDFPIQNREQQIPTGPWRSVDNSYMVFFHECFIDEIAQKKALSGFTYRQKLLVNNPRLLAVLERLGDLTSEKNISTSPRNIGFSLFQGYQSYCGVAIELSVENEKTVIDRAGVVADVGTVIDRGGLLAQLQGGFLYGLCAALHGELKIENGRYSQSNFDSYPVLRINETPKLEIEIISSTAAPGGAGELATPLAAPALANALFLQTGKRYSRLPIKI